MKDAPAYGLWSLVLINSLVFIIFAFSFAKPQCSGQVFPDTAIGT